MLLLCCVAAVAAIAAVAVGTVHAVEVDRAQKTIKTSCRVTAETLIFKSGENDRFGSTRRATLENECLAWTR